MLLGRTTVSVPLSGLSFLILVGKYVTIFGLLVSVPLSGLSFLINIPENGRDTPKESFRPLIGVIISNQVLRLLTQMSSYRCFRPLIGVIISNRISISMESRNTTRVSVPLSGLSFLIKVADVYFDFSESFRPLIGVIISNHNPKLIVLALEGLFPSPYRGYHF